MSKVATCSVNYRMSYITGQAPYPGRKSYCVYFPCLATPEHLFPAEVADHINSQCHGRRRRRVETLPLWIVWPSSRDVLSELSWMGLFLSRGTSLKLIILSILWNLLKFTFLLNMYPDKMLKIFVNMKRSNTPVLGVAGWKLLLQLEFSWLTHNLLHIWLCSHMWFWCFIQTVADWTVAVCFVMVGREDHLLLRAAGWQSAILSGLWI